MKIKNKYFTCNNNESWWCTFNDVHIHWKCYCTSQFNYNMMIVDFDWSENEYIGIATTAHSSIWYDQWLLCCDINCSPSEHCTHYSTDTCYIEIFSRIVNCSATTRWELNSWSLNCYEWVICQKRYCGNFNTPFTIRSYDDWLLICLIRSPGLAEETVTWQE